MTFVISFVDGEEALSAASPTAKEALSAASPTAKEALKAAGKLIEQGKQSVTITNSDTGEVYGHERIQETLEKGPDGT